MYWLEILNATNYVSVIEFESMHNQCIEVLKIIKYNNYIKEKPNSKLITHTS
jgi:hypothetical protein